MKNPVVNTGLVGTRSASDDVRTHEVLPGGTQVATTMSLRFMAAPTSIFKNPSTLWLRAEYKGAALCVYVPSVLLSTNAVSLRMPATPFAQTSLVSASATPTATLARTTTLWLATCCLPIAIVLACAPAR